MWLRALFLELERVANHLGDLGYLGNDAALAFGFAQFWILKEQMLRMNGELFGHRYLMDNIVPGGVTCVSTKRGQSMIDEMHDIWKSKVRILQGIYDEHAGMQDRFIATGRLSRPGREARAERAGRTRQRTSLGCTRAVRPVFPTIKLEVNMVTYRNGDVAARVRALRGNR